MKSGLQKRLVAGCAIVVTLLSVLTGRLIHIELMRGQSLSDQARAHYEHKQTLPAQRGRIFDRDGELLAHSQTVYNLVVDCHHLRDQGLACISLAEKEGLNVHQIKKKYLPKEILGRYREHVAESLAEALQTTRADLARTLAERETGEIVLAKAIEDDFSGKLEKILDDNRLGGLYLRRSERRYYPSPLTLTQVIGYVGEDGQGVSGIEKTMNAPMLGRDGYRYCERDRRRREILAYRGLQVEPTPGRDVYLTINMGLQAVVERELDSVIDTFRPEKVSAVFMDPQTGEVLAMSSRPHFNLADRKGIRGADPIRRNIALTDLYQPGSTFKIVGYGGAFDKGFASPMMEVDCHMGIYNHDGFPLKDHHPYGKLTAQTAFAKSSNIGAYLISRPLNEDGFYRYMREFGFGDKTGIELNAENSGRIYPTEKWSATSFSSQVMGYEVAVTPLQMAVAGSVIANGGIYRTPTIVKGIRGTEENAEIERASRQSERRVISEKAAREVGRCMVEAMTDSGTGSKGALPGYTVAGKTGTARKHIENVGYVQGRYIASFMGYFPADDPQLLGLIVIDDPHADEGAVYGGSVAAPVFKAIAQDAVKVLGIEPDLPEELIEMEDATLADANR